LIGITVVVLLAEQAPAPVNKEYLAMSVDNSDMLCQRIDHGSEEFE
jgi:hypothetical protein